MITIIKNKNELRNNQLLSENSVTANAMSINGIKVLLINFFVFFQNCTKSMNYVLKF